MSEPKYRRITREDRAQIERRLGEGKSLRRIADELGFSASSISREIRRGTILKGVPGGKRKGEYSAREAQRRAISTYRESRQTCFYRGHKIKGWVKDQIDLKLCQRWSPEQISNRLRLDQGVKISPEAIYKYIYSMQKRGAELHKALRRYGRRPKRGKRRSRYWEMQDQVRKPMEQRPKGANDRSALGHWERDLMLGKRGTGAILVLVDRKSQAALLRKLESTSCSETNTKTIEAISSVGGVIRCRSITNDNGHEFGEFWKLEKKIRAKIYFTRPLSPWERGTVENTIGLLRQFIPKGTDLRTWSDEDIELLERIMNARPRKSLRYLTPIEIIKRNKQKLITRRRVQDISWESAEKARWSA